MNIKEVFCGKSIKQDEIDVIVKNLLSWLKKKNIASMVESTQLMEDDDIKGEILCSLLEKKDYICSRSTVTFSLLCTIVKNHFIDLMRKASRQKIPDIRIDEPVSDDKKTTRGDRIEDKNFEVSPEVSVERIYISELIEVLRSSLSVREKEALCFQIYKRQRFGENPFLQMLSDDAKYQASSRLRKKLKKILPDDPFEELSTEGARLFIDLIVSEICEKIVNN